MKQSLSQRTVLLLSVEMATTKLMTVLKPTKPRSSISLQALQNYTTTGKFALENCRKVFFNAEEKQRRLPHRKLWKVDMRFFLIFIPHFDSALALSEIMLRKLVAVEKGYWACEEQLRLEKEKNETLVRKMMDVEDRLRIQIVQVRGCHHLRQFVFPTRRIV